MLRKKKLREKSRNIFYLQSILQYTRLFLEHENINSKKTLDVRENLKLNYTKVLVITIQLSSSRLL